MTEHWTKLRIRKGGHMSARTRVEQSPGLSRLLDERLSTLADPVRGITTDGVVRAKVCTRWRRSPLRQSRLPRRPERFFRH